MYYYVYGIGISDSWIDLDEILIENKQFYDNAVFREIMVGQLIENESYNTLFEET